MQITALGVTCDRHDKSRSGLENSIFNRYLRSLPAPSSPIPYAHCSALKHYGFPCFGYEGQKLLEALNVVQ